MKKIIFVFISILTMHLHGIFEYDRAISKSQKGDWQQSKELLKNVLIENPENPEILYDMGVSSFKSNESEKALSYFSKAAKSSNASPSLQEKAYYNAGNAHVQLKQLQEAIDAYDQALALNPSNKHAAHNKEVVKKMLEEQKEKDKKDEQDKKEDKNNKEKQDQKDNQDKNNKDSEKNSEDTQKNDQENTNNQEKKKNEQDQKESKQSQEKNEHDKQEQDAKNKKDKEQKEQQEKKESEEQNNQENGDSTHQSGKKDNENNNKQAQLSPALNRLLNEQEKKDAALNKQMIKAMAGTYTGVTDGYNCW